MRRRIAVIGAGVAGTLCARGLAEAGDRVEVFDKGRAVGGRLAQRRGDGAVFDHGAQFARAEDRVFARLLEAGVAAGAVARWPAAEVDGRPVYVGLPSMAAPLKRLLEGIPVRTGCRIAGLVRAADGWKLVDAEGGRHGPFAQVAITIPPVQAGELLRTVDDGAPAPLLAATEAVAMAPCWALLLAFAEPLAVAGFAARTIETGPLRWIAHNTTKPGRAGRDSWTAHAAPDWSNANLEAPIDEVKARLLDAFRTATGRPTADPLYLDVHRWRYAQVTRPLGRAAVFDVASGLGLAGDWCLGGRIEAAFLSGRALARAIRGAADDS